MRQFCGTFQTLWTARISSVCYRMNHWTISAFNKLYERLLTYLWPSVFTRIILLTHNSNMHKLLIDLSAASEFLVAQQRLNIQTSHMFHGTYFHFFFWPFTPTFTWTFYATFFCQYLPLCVVNWLGTFFGMTCH